MKFIAIHKRGAIMTDDYTLSEILRGDNIENIKEDIKYLGIRGAVRVYDENDRLVCKLNKKKTA